MLEKDLERKCGKVAKELGCLFWKFTSPGTTGVPDRILVGPGGVVIFVELKTAKGRISPKQQVQMDKLRQRGAKVWLIREFEMFKEYLDEAMSA